MRALRCLLCLTVAFGLASPALAQERSWHGLTFETLTLKTARERGLFGVFQGALITRVDRRSVANGGLKPGDAILVADDTPITHAEALTEALTTVGEGGTIILTRMRRDAITARVTLKRPQQRRPIRLGTQPLLMLDTGGHMALVKALAFTKDGKQLVSTGNDKVIRVWDLTTGRTVRTIRGDALSGRPGQLFALALSPNERWLAAGGFTHPQCPGRCGEIRIYDFQSGQLVKRLPGHSDKVNALAFSPNGRHLISSSHDETAILWEAQRPDGKSSWSQGRLKHRLEGHTGHIYAVHFTPAGKRVVTGSYDKTLRVWDVESGALRARLVGHTDEVSRALSIAPDGTIASGDFGGNVRLWSASDIDSATAGQDVTRSRVFSIAASGEVSTLTFNSKGDRLLATAGYGDISRHQLILDVTTGEVLTRFTGHANAVYAGVWSADGRWVATAGAEFKEIAIWDPRTGELGTSQNGSALRLVGGGRPTWATGVSADGQWIGWGNIGQTIINRATRIEFALRLPLATERLAAPVRVDGTSDAPDAWLRAAHKHGAWQLRHRKGTLRNVDAVLDVREGQRVRTTITRGPTDGYGHSSYSFAPDGKTFVSGGSNGVLLAYGRDGKKLGAFVGHEGEVWDVTPSADGRFLVSGSGDQTVRFWNLETRELVFTLFHAPTADGDVGDWVIWTPQGFYTGSQNAGGLVGWQINNGPDKAADYITGGQVRKSLNRPDIIEEAIRLASAKAAVDKLAPGHDLARLLSARPPSLTLVTPDAYSEEFRGSVNVTAFVDEGSFAVDKYEVSVNGIRVPTVRGSVPAGHRRPPEGRIVEAFSVPLADGRNVIEIKAVSAAGESTVVKLPVSHNGEGPLDKRGKLYVVAVGVDNYSGLAETCGPAKNESCSLELAGKDARLFMDTISNELGARHVDGVWSRLLTNQGKKSTIPTRRNILAALDGLTSANETDTVALFLAGHGERGKDGKYYFLPTDIARPGGLEAIGEGRNIIEWSEIQSRLTKAKGRRMLFIDSCQSGALGSARAYNGRLLEDAQYESFVAFMAAGPNQYAIERTDIGNGLFTHALTKGITGAARKHGERIVRVLSLGRFVAERVHELSRGRQQPVYTPHADFVLAAQ